jgi:3-deoxy-D-manno-octulosonic-acid transferase
MPTWFRLLYSLLWALLLPLAFARIAWRGRSNPGYWQHWGERVAMTLPRGPFDLWIHAVSVGEARASLPLIQAFLAQGKRIIVTCTTPTGRATLASALPEAVTVCYLPYDAPWLISQFLRAARPALAVLLETELWPGVCDEARRARVPLWLVNARLSARSARGYGRGGSLTRAMLGCLAGVAAQTADHAQRFRALGAGNVHVTGNSKFDIALPADIELRSAELATHLTNGRAFWVAASTREGEEAMLFDALANHPLRKQAVAVIVPRHPERWGEALESARRRGFRVALRSDAQISADTEVIVGNSMGEMLAYCARAQVVVMGGSLGGTGSQNLIEPCALGVPVVLGPSVFNFQQAAEEAIAAGAAVSVADATTALDATLHWLHDGSARNIAGRCAKGFVAAHRGATERTLTLLAAGG